MNNSFFCVVTTIQSPTPSMRTLAGRLRESGGRLLVIGDRKGPASFALRGSEFFDLSMQQELDFKIASLLPEGHYARKNLGYLVAISRCAGCIYETDDDNAPDRLWKARSEAVPAFQVTADPWVNIYSFFSNDRIWPRGFPLDHVVDSFNRHPRISEAPAEVRAPIQQGLVNNSPDVDAVWRLTLDREIKFMEGPSICLSAGTWSPFNSQSTWWWPAAYPLMYLPSNCSFRMTDIWRSFIAQRCLWEMELGVVFHGPEVVQQRNEHNLMGDFADEIPGYTRNTELVAVLERLRLDKGADRTCDNLLACYDALVGARFFPAEEMKLVASWVEDLRSAART